MSTDFNKEWVTIEDYKDWLVEDADTKFAKCRVYPPPKKGLLYQTWGNGHWLAI